MEIRAYAERVLTSEALADKLLPPGPLTDAHPGDAGRLPETPARPEGLRFVEIRARAPLPRPGELADPAARVVLLHAFANHELLAMELMARLLLRGLALPAAFRRGLAHILHEEQIHLGLYLDRLAAHGARFGELPVNRFLWDCVAPAEGVRDFCARMGLTFEAANLDHALDWATALRRAGDEESAAVLDRVYRDELGHVRHALHWFKAELPEGADLWATWTGLLSLPLSPERARGRVLSVEARRQAGFDEDFIEALSLASFSKGRLPTVRLFNPDAEAQVAAGDPAFLPQGPAEALARDLDLLPAQLAVRDDVVVVRRPPRPAFLRQLQAAGMTLPQIVVAPDPCRLGESELLGRKIGAIDPWAWSPASAAWVAPLLPGLRAGAQAAWQERWRDLYSKVTAHQELLGLLALQACDDGLVTASELGASASSEAEVRELAAGILARGYGSALIKAAFGTAGRGGRRLRSAAAGEADRRWLAAALAQGPVVVQPWLDRVLDLSFHLDVAMDGTVAWRGGTRFFTTASGRYQGTWVGPVQTDVPTPILRFLHQDGRDPRWLHRLSRTVADRVGARAAALGYAGPIGIDAFVYRRGEELRLQPLVEINPRTTMGRVGLALRARLASGVEGLFVVLSRSDLKQAGYNSFLEWSRARGPAICQEGRITGGVWFPTDPEPAAEFASALAVGVDRATCLHALGL